MPPVSQTAHPSAAWPRSQRGILLEPSAGGYCPFSVQPLNSHWATGLHVGCASRAPQAGCAVSGGLLKDTSPEQFVATVRMVRSGDALLTPSITRRLIERLLRTSQFISHAGRLRRRRGQVFGSGPGSPPRTRSSSRLR